MNEITENNLPLEGKIEGVNPITDDREIITTLEAASPEEL